MMRVIHAVFFNLPALAAMATALVLTAAALGVGMRRAMWCLTILLLVVLALHVTVFFSAALAYVNFPYEGKSVVEGVSLYNAMSYLQGEQPYRPPEEAPFRSLVYPPVHELALAGAVGALGPGLGAARLFSLLCVLATCVAAALVVWRHTRNPLATAFGGLFFLCCYGICGHWMEQVRNDALLAFLLVLGLHLAERAGARGRLPVGGGIILLLALYTKQTAALAPMAVAVWLWFRCRRHALIWSAGFVAAALAVFVGFEVWSGGWFAFYILKVPAAVGVEWNKYDLAATFFSWTWVVLWAAALAAAPALKALPSRRDAAMENQKDLGLWALALLFALPLCLLQSLKWGAALNAFVPLAPILGILAAIAFDRFTKRFEKFPWARAGLVAAAIMQLAMIAYQPRLPGPADYRAQERIAEWVRSSWGDVFVSVFSSQAYLNGREYFGDNVPIGDLERGGLWRAGELVKKTRQGEFAVMILRPRVEPADLAEAVAENYVGVERISMRGTVGRWPYMQVYVPREREWHPASDAAP